MNIKYYFIMRLILILLMSAGYSYGQNDFNIVLDRNAVPLNFTNPVSVLSSDSISVVTNYTDTIGKEYFQKRFSASGEITWAYFRNESNSSISCSFNRYGGLTSLVTRYGINHTTQFFYSDGRVKMYSFWREDTNSVIITARTEDSYVIKYNEDGSLNTMYFVLKKKQKYEEYWPNGEKKISGQFYAQSELFVDNYKVFSENGELLISGKYDIHTNKWGSSSQIKIGKWKYYKGGRMVKVEDYNNAGDLVNTEFIQ